MADYWKSLPKKYCDFCKCWITDNKASRDFHERGFRHQANVRRRVKDIQKNSSVQEREKQEYNNMLLKIESAALNSFKNDVQNRPELANEYNSSKSFASKIIESRLLSEPKKPVSTNRFGESFDNDGESQTLVNGKKRALDTIAQSFEKRSRWLEAQASDGSFYYWNKETLETRRDPPKSGFLSVKEQEQFKNLSTSSKNEEKSTFEFARPSLLGSWKTVKNKDATKMIDFQLPNQDLLSIVLDTEQVEEKDQPHEKNVIFKEKTVETMKKRIVSKNEINITFKKRSSSNSRNIRSQKDSD